MLINCKFQFLDGAIKSNAWLRSSFIHRKFQFLDGAIKRMRGLGQVLFIENFNSLMVRLKDFY